MNPRHPLIKELKRRVDDALEDQTTKDLAYVLYETATLRSGYFLPDSADFAGRVERMLRLSMNVGLDEKVFMSVLLLLFGSFCCWSVTVGLREETTVLDVVLVIMITRSKLFVYNTVRQFSILMENNTNGF